MLYTKVAQAVPVKRQQIQAISEAAGVSPLTAGILLRRGMTDPAAIKEFLEGKSQPYGDPFQIKNMEKAAERILAALAQKEKITIYGDYDVDGTSASSLLYLFLKKAGGDIHVYIPRRDTEGYGLNVPALEKIAAGGTTLLVTVDTGISGAKEVAAAPQTMDIIVTDHHLVPPDMPPAFTVVNPHQEGETYPFQDFAGVGVAFKLCQALWQKLHHTKEYWEDLVELAALGTVADMVPLLGENREIVRRGLQKFSGTHLLGVKALTDVTVSPGTKVTAGTIGFGLGPRINAAGRLDDAMTAVRLMTSSDPEEAAALAAELNSANQERQALSQKIFEEALAALEKEGLPEWGVVLGKEGWHPGVIGIVASRITDKFHRPSILLSINGDMAKGSCRSIPPLHLYHALEQCRDLLVQFGGHAQAAGLTLKTENIPAFREKFNQVVADMLDHQPYEPVCTPDYFVPEDHAVTQQDVEELEKLAPFGVGNPSPVLGFARAQIARVDLLGKDRNHLKFDLVHGGTHYKGLLWQEGERYHWFYPGEEARVAFSPSLNTFRGVTSVNLEISGVEAGCTIIDYRHENRDKKTTLENILQNDKKTVVYSCKPVANPPECSGVRFLAYGDALPEDARTVVFYDGGAEKVLQPGHFPLKAGRPGRLILLYGRDDLVEKREQLRRRYPDVAGMRCCYAAIRQKLQGQGACGEKELLGLRTREGFLISRDVLEIFYGLRMFLCRNGLVSLGETAKKNMQAAAGFQKLQAAYDREFKKVNRSWQMSPGEIADLWRRER